MNRKHFCLDFRRWRASSGTFRTISLIAMGTLGFALAGCGSKNVGPGEDDGVPSVSISSPQSGTSVSGVGLYVTGSVRDTDSLTAVHLDAGNVPLDSITSSGVETIQFSFFLPTALFAAGEELTIVVRARDKAGEEGSRSVTVTPAEPALRQVALTSLEEREPAWSPDGGRIAYAAGGISGQRDVWIVGAEGGDPSQFTDNVNEDRSPTWSPDAQYIAFASDRGGNWDIWTMPAVGGTAMAVTTNGSADRGPDWSPSGGSIAFHSSRDGNWNIYSVAVTGAQPSGAPTALTGASSAESSAVWIDDGNSLIMASNQNVSVDIWRVTPPEVTLESVAGANDGSVLETDPHGSRLGDYLLFADNRNGNFDIWIVHPPSGTKRVIAAHTSNDREPAWSRRGDQIAFSSARNGTYDIWVAE